MAILTRLLLLLLALRLLVPPGICLCKLSSPAARLLATALGNDPPPPPVETEGHHDGCPASGLSEGLGLRPASPEPVAASFQLADLPPAAHEAAPSAASVSPLELPFAAAPRPPLCVSHCALRC